MLLQLAQRHRGALVRQPELEVVGNGVKDLVARERWRGEVDRLDVRRQPLHQHPAQHGLAAAYFARQLDDALVVQDGVDQRFQGGAPVGAVEEKVGVRRDAERRLGEPEVLQVKRSEEHTSELQSLAYLVCRLLLEKKKKSTNSQHSPSQQQPLRSYPTQAGSSNSTVRQYLAGSRRLLRVTAVLEPTSVEPSTTTLG